MNSDWGRGFKVLVVDDEPGVRLVLQRLLQTVGCTVGGAERLAEARARHAQEPFDLLIADKNLPDGSGLELVDACEAQPPAELIIMTAYANLESAMQAIQLKVADYLVKPFSDIDEVRGRVRRVLETLRLKRENLALIRELKEKNSRLEDLVLRDGLTGLYNHAFLQERLEAEVSRSQRTGQPFGLLFIDVDHFKSINDSCGHQVGDAILRGISDVMKGGAGGFALREHDLAARYGGDEFVLLLPETNKSGATAMAERLRRYVAGMSFGSMGARATLSIGIAAFPSDGQHRRGLVQAADAALYAAKRMGRNRVVSFTPVLVAENDVDPEVAANSTPQAELLDAALQRRAFRAFYQPIVESEGLRIIGHEALCRPLDSRLGNIAELLAVADGLGRLADLGRLLRELALAPLPSLGPEGYLFINLHPGELADAVAVDARAIPEELRRRVVFEISETMTIKDYDSARRCLKELRAKGFLLALDDVGAGYAGLTALAQLEADFIKLDRSLVQHIDTDPRTSRLVRHVLDYAQAEGIQVIAEGVERPEEWATLQDLGCRLFQGYLFCRPQPTLVRTLGAEARLATGRSLEVNA